MWHAGLNMYSRGYLLFLIADFYVKLTAVSPEQDNPPSWSSVNHSGPCHSLHVLILLCCKSVWLHTLDFALSHVISPVFKIIYAVDYYYSKKRLNCPRVIPQYLSSDRFWVYSGRFLIVMKTSSTDRHTCLKWDVGHWASVIWATPVLSGRGFIQKKVIME